MPIRASFSASPNELHRARVRERLLVSLSLAGRARLTVAVLCAHLFTLAEDRDLPLSLSSAERDRIERAAALGAEEATRMAERTHTGDLKEEARTYLSSRFVGTTLEEKQGWLGLGLSSTELSSLVHALMLREGMLEALAALKRKEPESRVIGFIQEIERGRISLPAQHIPCLSFAFPKCNEKRLLVRFVSSFFKDTDPMSFVNADTGQCPEDAYAAWFSSLSRIIDTLDHATESMAIAAALSRELSRAFSKKTSVAELIDAVRETLTFFIAGLEDEKSTDDEKTEVEESVLDGILASALREGDTGGALRVAALRSGSSALSYEELRGVIKGLIIPESVKRELLVRSEGEPTFDSP